MKRWIVCFAALAAASCGNYSNDDLEFLNALPHEGDLTVKPPGVSQSGLNSTDAGMACSDQLGSPSCFFENTLAMSAQINTNLFFLLGVVDAIQLYPPTSRTVDSRIWGPFRADNQPTFDVEIVIQRTQPAHYAYRIEYEPQGGATWFPFISGQFTSNGGPRRGIGAIAIDGAGAMAEGLDTGALGAAFIQGAYDTRGSPLISVQMNASMQADGGPINILSYESHEYVDSNWGPDAGSLQFTAPFATDAGVLELTLHSHWDFNGAGIGEAVVQSPVQYAGRTGTQCWGAQPNFLMTYAAESWSGGTVSAGDAGACPVLPP